MNTIRNNCKRLLALSCVLLGCLGVGCVSTTEPTSRAAPEPAANEITFPVDMVWWPDTPPTKLAETEPGTYAQNQVVRAGEEFPEKYLNANK